MAEFLAAPAEIRFWLSIAWAAYLVALGIWILLQKHEPAATLGWLLSLALLPLVGFLLYYLFGPRRLRRQRLRRARARCSLEALVRSLPDQQGAGLFRVGGRPRHP